MDNYIYLERCQILTAVTIDSLEFKVTLCPMRPEACLLWFRDVRDGTAFRVLGRFSAFDRRNVLDFVVRYAVEPGLREEIAERIFAQRVGHLSPAFFENFEHLSPRERERGYRSLFDLDGLLDRHRLAARRRIMAKRFHPDAGGSSRAMQVINEAYDYLAERSRGPS